jgi:hypothetical protein
MWVPDGTRHAQYYPGEFDIKGRKGGGIMKRGLLLSVVLSVLVSIPVAGWSYTIVNYTQLGTFTYANSGQYLGTVVGENDSETVLEGVLAQLGILVDLTSSTKINAPAGSGTDDFNLFVTYADGGKSGTWATFGTLLPPAGAQLVDFYVVKATNDFALYLQSPAASSGTWNTGNLRTGNLRNVPEISHFTGYATSIPVSEPGTLMLLGTGLVGMAVAGRRQRRK